MRAPRHVHALVLLFAAGAFAACGSSGDGSRFGDGPAKADADLPDAGEDDGSLFAGDGPGLGGDGAFTGALAFDPPEVTLTLDGTNPKTASFTLRATTGGVSTAVSPTSLQFDRPDLAKTAIGSPVVLTAAGEYAGTGTLHAVYGAKEATAKLTVIVHVQDVAPGTDPAAVTALGGANLPADAALTSLLYPYDQTVFPLGLASPLLMWTAPSAADVYHLHLEQKNYAYDGYFKVAPAAQRRVSQATWDRLTASNGGDPLKVTLSRYDAASKTAFTSASQAWTVVPASLRGAIYYWTTSAGGHMSRIRPGTGALPETINGGKCTGCHAVSADGTTLVGAVEGQVTSDGSNDNRAWVSFDLPAATVRKASSSFAGNVAVNPDGKYTVYGSQTLKLGDTATGLQIPNSGIETVALDPGMKGLMTPAFSPDGKKLAAVEGTGSWYHNLTSGKLVVLDFDEGTRKFSNLVGLAPATTFAAGQRAISYPTFAPDSTWLAFHVGDYATGCDAQGCTDAALQIGALWMQSTAGAAPIKLTKLTDSSALASDHNLSLEPTFNPVERGGYFWVVFTSMRDWGNKIQGTPNNGKKRLWVAAIDKTIGSVDPSHPPFFLEGQEEATTNMRGFWALAACVPTPEPGAGGGACAGGFECCSGFCDRGTCVDKGTLACKGAGDTCQVSADCCNTGAVTCVQNVCTPLVPR